MTATTSPTLATWRAEVANGKTLLGVDLWKTRRTDATETDTPRDAITGGTGQ
jgi:hypothetical protein